MNTIDYRKERALLVKSLRRKLARHLWESGYREGPIGKSRPLKIWVPRKDGKPTNQTFRLRGGYLVQEFEGFCEGGVILDHEGGGMVTMGFDECPIEDLFRLNLWAERKFAASNQKKEKDVPARKPA